MIRPGSGITQSGPCFKSGGDHSIRDCPHQKQTQGPSRPRFFPIERHYPMCCVDHFPKDCPSKLVERTAVPPKTSLILVEVIPSPVTSKIDVEDVSIKVITRSKAVKEAQVQAIEISENPKEKVKCRVRQKPCLKRTKNKKNKNDESPEEPNKSNGKTRVSNSSKTSSGGSVIVDKVLEPLQAALDAYNSRIATLQELPKKL